MKHREYFLYSKKIKIATFFQQFVSSLSLLVSVAPFWILPIEHKQCTLFCIRLNARMGYFHSTQSVNTRRIHPCVEADAKEHTVISKIVIFIFFAYKTDSRRFIKFRLNHWWQMDYPDDAFHTSLNLDSVIYLAVYETVTSLPVFI